MAGSEHGRPSWTASDWQQMLPWAPNWSRPPVLSGRRSKQAAASTATIERMHEHQCKRRHWRRSESIASMDANKQLAGNEYGTSKSSGGRRDSDNITGACSVRWWNYCETRDAARLLPVSARAISRGQQACRPRFGYEQTKTLPAMLNTTANTTSGFFFPPLPLAQLDQPSKRKGKGKRPKSWACFTSSWRAVEFQGALAKLSMLLLLAFTSLFLFYPVGQSFATIVSAKLPTRNESGAGRDPLVGKSTQQQQPQPPLSAAGLLSLANESRLVKAALSSVMSIEPQSGLQQSNLVASNSKQQQLQHFQRQPLQQQHQLRPPNGSSILNATPTGSDYQPQPEQESILAAASVATADKFSPHQQLIRANESMTDEYSDLERYFTMGIIILDIVIFIIGFCGNTIVILVILKFTKVKSVTDVYILNLAFADLMFLTGLLFLIITMFTGHWIFGALMCKLYMATTSLNQFASSLLLVVMSFDRFLAVCHPFYAQQFRRLGRAVVICLCIWIICVVLMAPILIFAKIDNSRNNDLVCTIIWPEYKSIFCDVAFTLYSFTIGFAGPLLLIAIFHVCVIRKLRHAANGNAFSTRRSRTRESSNRRVEHLVIGIICTYTICWLPYWIGQLGVSFTNSDNSPVKRFWCLYLVATSLEYFNSALNPILYAFLSDNFKRRCSEIGSSCAKWWLIFRRAIFNARGGGYNSELTHHRLGVSTTNNSTACYEMEPSQSKLRSTSATFPSKRNGEAGSSNLAERVSKASRQNQRQKSSPKWRTPSSAGASNENGAESGADCVSSASTSSSDCGCGGFSSFINAARNNNNNPARRSSNLAPANSAASLNANVNQANLSPSQLVARSSSLTPLPDSQGQASTCLSRPVTPTQSNLERLASSIRNSAATGSGVGISRGSSSGSSSNGSAKLQITAPAAAESMIESSSNQRKKGVAFSGIDTVVVHKGMIFGSGSSSKNRLTIQQQQRQQQLQQRDKGDGGQCHGV